MAQVTVLSSSIPAVNAAGFCSGWWKVLIDGKPAKAWAAVKHSAPIAESVATVVDAAKVMAAGYSADVLEMAAGYVFAAETLHVDGAYSLNAFGARLSDDARLEAMAVCAAFLSANGDDCRAFAAHVKAEGCDTGEGLESVGHDLWLTRLGHGAGFWDRGAGDLGARLTEAAEALGYRSTVDSNSLIDFDI